jgi:ionotropic glutamate receptor
MWVFLVLILTTSYTANLTSVLTIQQLYPAMNDLTDKDYVGFQAGSFIEGFLRDMGFDEGRLRRYSSMDEYADAPDKGSDNGGVTAIFDEVPYLRLFLSRYCHGYSMVGPTYKSGGFGFVRVLSLLIHPSCLIF